MARSATAKQVNYIDALSKQMVTLTVSAKAYGLPGADDYAQSAEDVVNALAYLTENGTLTMDAASKAIDDIIESNRVLTAKIKDAQAKVLAAAPDPDPSPF